MKNKWIVEFNIAKMSTLLQIVLNTQCNLYHNPTEIFFFLVEIDNLTLTTYDNINELEYPRRKAKKTSCMGTLYDFKTSKAIVIRLRQNGNLIKLTNRSKEQKL